MPTPKKKPPQKTKTPPQRTKKPKQNLTSKPAKPTPKKSIKRLSNRKEGQPIPEPILRFFDVREIPSPLELAKLAVSLAAAENGKPSPKRALEFLEETAETIQITKDYITHYEKSRMPPMHFNFKDGIRYIIDAKGQSRPKRERKQFMKILLKLMDENIRDREHSLWLADGNWDSGSKYQEAPDMPEYIEKMFSQRMQEWEKYGISYAQANGMKRGQVI
jgi:hypothetical protein